MSSHLFKTRRPRAGQPEGMDTTTENTAGATPRTDHNIWPATFYDDAHAQRQWLAQLGFEEGIVVPGDEPGTIHHSEMLWPDGGRVMVASRVTSAAEYGEARGGGVYVVCTDPDAVAARVEAMGLAFHRPLESQTEYESRGFSVRDPEGVIWSFGTYAG